MLSRAPWRPGVGGVLCYFTPNADIRGEKGNKEDEMAAEREGGGTLGFGCGSGVDKGGEGAGGGGDPRGGEELVPRLAFGVSTVTKT